jgi:hypothetical protein
MSDYDPPQFLQQLRSAYYGPTDTPEEVWNNFREAFSRKTPDQRRGDLMAMDKWLDQYDRPTRETADFLSKRRNLLDVHSLLLRANR